MDILEQYEKQNPEQRVPQNIYQDSSQDYGPIVSLVIRFSKGKIQNEQQANAVLIVAVASIIIISALIVMSSGAPQGENMEHLFPPGSSALAPELIR